MQHVVAQGVGCGSLKAPPPQKKGIFKGRNVAFVHLTWGLYSIKLEVVPPEIFQVITQAWDNILNLDALLNRKVIPRLP